MRTIHVLIPLLFLSFTSCGPPSPAVAIETVLNECAKISAQASASGASSGEIADFIARHFQSIDTRDCPQDFRHAFQTHVNAWRTAAPYFAQDTHLNAFLEGFTAGLTGDSSVLGNASQGAQTAAWQINSTYNQLVQIAISHGAKIPNSAVR